MINFFNKFEKTFKIKNTFELTKNYYLLLKYTNFIIKTTKLKCFYTMHNDLVAHLKT